MYWNGRKAFEGNEMIVASSSLQAEAYALYKGLCDAHMKGIQHIQIYSDSAELVRAIDSQFQAFEITTLIHDVRAIRRKFSRCTIKKVARVEVYPAHSLAVATRKRNLIM